MTAGFPFTNPTVAETEARKDRRGGKRNVTKRNHPLSGENLFLTTLGSRGCKECRKVHKRTYLEKARG